MSSFEVFRVYYPLIGHGVALGIFESDLVFVDDVPTIVFDWTESSFGRAPLTTAELATDHLKVLHQSGSERHFVYSRAVEDPRNSP
jgi:hypothetical protein